MRRGAPSRRRGRRRRPRRSRRAAGPRPRRRPRRPAWTRRARAGPSPRPAQGPGPRSRRSARNCSRPSWSTHRTAVTKVLPSSAVRTAVISCGPWSARSVEPCPRTNVRPPVAGPRRRPRPPSTRRSGGGGRPGWCRSTRPRPTSAPGAATAGGCAPRACPCPGTAEPADGRPEPQHPILLGVAPRGAEGSLRLSPRTSRRARR